MGYNPKITSGTCGACETSEDNMTIKLTNGATIPLTLTECKLVKDALYEYAHLAGEEEGLAGEIAATLAFDLRAKIEIAEPKT